VRIGAPVARPRNVLAIGLNYADHAKETGPEWLSRNDEASGWNRFRATPTRGDSRLGANGVDRRRLHDLGIVDHDARCSAVTPAGWMQPLHIDRHA
jgi:hypothetical protein